MFSNLGKESCRNLFTKYSNLNYILSCKKHTVSNTDLEKRQAELMARSLPKKKPIPGVKDILIVASGKGGVGKSTTAVNLAAALTALQQPKLEIGLLDADVFGPSIPLMMNLNESPLLTDDDLMIPLINYGIKCMSMGFLVTERSALMWRGLMVMQALEKLLRKVHWGTVDILVVDTPPGTGDTHLSLVQNLPISGVLLVTTPQEAALQVTRRGATMFQKLQVPIVGIVQNMSSVVCDKCQNKMPLFGDKVSQLVDQIGVNVIQDFPLDPDISSCSDSGRPIVIDKPNSIQLNNIGQKDCDLVPIGKTASECQDEEEEDEEEDDNDDDESDTHDDEDEDVDMELPYDVSDSPADGSVRMPSGPR